MVPTNDMTAARSSGESVDSSTALAYATSRVPRASPGQTVSSIRDSLGAQRFDSATDVAVLDGDRLVGLIRVEDLLAASAGVPANSIMDADPPVIGPGVDQETAAVKAVEHEESSIAVVGRGGRFLGLIPPHRMLGVLLEEHREDLARLSGFLHESSAARSASQERLVLRFWHRFPWLLVGLAAAMAAASIVAAFEQGLSSHLELVFFIPGIVYIADAVGTQTETLVVRGLSVGVPVERVMRHELVTGVQLGAALGAISYPIVAIWFDADIALTVAGSILAASTAATAVAMMLPWIFSRLGIDPAFGSGPLATVAQDLLSLTVYFLFAMMIVL